jgi:hypothetical protein
MSFILISLQAIFTLLAFLLLILILFWIVIQKYPVKKVVYYTIFNLYARKDIVKTKVNGLLVLTNKSRTLKCTFDNFSKFKLVINSEVIYETYRDNNGKLARSANSLRTTDQMLPLVTSLSAVATNELCKHFQNGSVVLTK